MFSDDNQDGNLNEDASSTYCYNDSAYCCGGLVLQKYRCYQQWRMREHSGAIDRSCRSYLQAKACASHSIQNTKYKIRNEE